MKRCLWLTALILAFLSLTVAAGGEDMAQDLTKRCKYAANMTGAKLKHMYNNNYNNYWDSGESGEVRVTCPRGELAQGVMLSFFKDPVAVTVVDDDGEELARYEQPYATDWVPFSHPAKAFTMKPAKPGETMRLNNIHVLGEGRLPDWVQRWSTLEGNAELMLIVTHPDDEILWFGGMLPKYAGELGRKVMVVYMVGGNNGMRTSELLDGLWAMGVRLYPDIGKLPDVTGASMKAAAEHWGGEDVAPRRVAQVIRRYRPLVVATQDVRGEYGHYHHIIMTQAVIDVVTKYGADPDFDPESAALYGTYTPLKLYVHLWRENRVKFNWREPLSAFGGKTGLEVARAAFRLHVSQRSGKPYRVADSGGRDNSLFGLYFTSVGPDVQKNDLFENVPLDDMTP